MADPTFPDNIESLFDDAVPTLNSRISSGEGFLPASHIQLLEQLEHLSRYSHFIQIVSGVSGVGKSTLLRQFYQNADDSAVHGCHLQAPANLNEAALLGLLTEQLNLDSEPGASTEQQLQALVEHSKLLKQLSRQLLIVIDDAENLELDALELLFNQLSTLADEELRPHIVLFADPSIRTRLEAPSLREVVETSCHFIELQPLNQEELNALLEHSYSAVAARLGDNQRKLLLADTLGLPGRLPRAIEVLMNGRKAQPTDSADKAQIMADLHAQPAAKTDAKPSESKRRLPLWPIFGTLTLAAIGAGAWYGWPLLQQLNQLQTATPASAQSDDQDSSRIRIDLPLTAKPTVSETPAPETAPQTSDFEQRLAQARAALEAEQQPSTIEPPEQSKPDRPTPTNTQQLALAPIKTDTAPQEEQASTAVNSVETPTAETTTPPTLVLELPAAPIPQTENELQPGQQASTEPASAPSAPEPIPVYYGDGKQLLEWDSKGYTLQMLGARQEPSVGKFIAALPQRDRLKSFYTLYKEKPWYVVVYGQYPNRSAAMEAIGDLPPELRSRRPWARSILGVQNDIRKGGN